MATCAGRDIWCTAGRGAAVAVVLQEAAIGQTVDSHAMDGALSPFHIIVKGRVAEWTSARSSRSRLGGGAAAGVRVEVDLKVLSFPFEVKVRSRL